MDSNYKYKYNKYKSKYLELCLEQFGGKIDETEIDPYYYTNNDGDTMIDVRTSDYPPGFDLDSDTVTIKDSETVVYSDTEDKPINTNIGQRGLARGTTKKEFETDKLDYTTLKKPDRKKILKLDTLDDFDNFTEKYAYLHTFKDRSPKYGLQQLLLIKWDKVAKKYGGIFINQGLTADRFENAFYKGETYRSWWKYDLQINDVVVFKKDDFNIAKPNKQTKPFKAHIYKEHEIPEERIIDIYSEPDKKKVLFIYDIKDFDIFTNKYGKLVNNKIKIEWNKVKKDYQGFYIDKDSNVYTDRVKKAFLNDMEFDGWLRRENIKRKAVYVFTNKLFI